MRVKVSIITVNYNGYDDTCALIESIPLNDKSLEVIVVDNASRINEAEKISAKYPLVKTSLSMGSKVPSKSNKIVLIIFPLYTICKLQKGAVQYEPLPKLN